MLQDTVWLTLKPSPIAGIGVFAIRDIPPGTKVIWEYDTVETESLTMLEFELLPTEIQEEILHRTIFVKNEPIEFLSPNCATNYRSYMNHSKTPNTDGITTLVAIKKGEELTEDYKTMGNWHRLTIQHMVDVV